MYNDEFFRQLPFSPGSMPGQQDQLGQPPFAPFITSPGQLPFGPPFTSPGQQGQFGQPPFGPPFTSPGQQGQFGQPPFGPPFTAPGQQGQFGPPTTPPPSFIPSQASAQALGQPTGAAGVFAVEPGAILPCRFRFVFLWLNNGQQFWAWLTFVGRRSVAGWRWNGRRWVYFGLDLNRIAFFVCF